MRIIACLGYFLYYKCDYQTVKRKLLPLWILNMITMSLTCYVTYKKIIITGDLSFMGVQTYFSAFDIINCFTMFLTIRYIFLNCKISDKTSAIIRSIGGCTFNIYLLHVFIMEKTEFSKIKNILQEFPGLNDMLAIFIYCLLVMLTGYFITLIMKKIPGLRKLI